MNLEGGGKTLFELSVLFTNAPSLRCATKSDAVP